MVPRQRKRLWKWSFHPGMQTFGECHCMRLHERIFRNRRLHLWRLDSFIWRWYWNLLLHQQICWILWFGPIRLTDFGLLVRKRLLQLSQIQRIFVNKIVIDNKIQRIKWISISQQNLQICGPFCIGRNHNFGCLLDFRLHFQAWSGHSSNVDFVVYFDGSCNILHFVACWCRWGNYGFVLDWWGILTKEKNRLSLWQIRGNRKRSQLILRKKVSRSEKQFVKREEVKTNLEKWWFRHIYDFKFK